MRKFAQRKYQSQLHISFRRNEPLMNWPGERLARAHLQKRKDELSLRLMPAEQDRAHDFGQTKRCQAIDSLGNSVPPIVNDAIRSSGGPLDPFTQEFMESRFGHDFSEVRVHTDSKAAESAQAIDALAYTVGRDVVFGAGQFVPTTSAGRQLIAHELTHVLQQRGGGQPDGGMSSPGDTCERLADDVANEVVRPGRGDRNSSIALSYGNTGAVLSLMRQEAKGVGLPDEREIAIGYIGKVVDLYGRGEFLKRFARYKPNVYSNEQETCISDLEFIAGRLGQKMNMNYFEDFLQSIGMRADAKLNPEQLTYTLKPRLVKLQADVWDSPGQATDLWKIGEDYSKKKLSKAQKVFLAESIENKGFTQDEFFEWIQYGLTGKPETK